MRVSARARIPLSDVFKKLKLNNHYLIPNWKYSSDIRRRKLRLAIINSVTFKLELEISM